MRSLLFHLQSGIRLAHAVEIGVSNFIFGVLAVLLLVEREARRQSVETVHA